MEIKEHNKKCVEALGCYVGKDGGLSDVPIEWYEKHNVTFFHVSDLHFHDSYDWAMLLVHSMDDEHRWLVSTLLGVKWYQATPQQISQACLEVLGGN